jgi:predicted metal-dependent hydrolase
MSDTEDRNLEWICRSALHSVFSSFRNAEIKAYFYPYIGLTHTIRRKGSGWMLRISDHCRQAPRELLEAIALMLGYKVMRRKPPAKLIQAYESFREDPSVLEAVRSRRLRKGRKHFSTVDGKCHSLQKIFRELNRSYFNNQVEMRNVGWGLRRSRRRLGHYDPVHNTITLSPVLDSHQVPRYVVAYILYHEILHALYEGKSHGRRNRHHPPEFRRAERAYPDYVRARKFLEGFGRRAGIGSSGG